MSKYIVYVTRTEQGKVEMAPADLDEITTPTQATDYAIEYQNWASERSMSYGELAEWQNAFVKLADKFGLNDEFTENGII